MPKGLYVGNASAKASKVKKLYVGDANNKARKLKKLYVGDANGKARLLWSSNLGKFLFSQQTKTFLSDDGISYTQNGTTNPKSFTSVVYALGKFWACNTSSYEAYVYSSEDGENWTLASTVKGDCYFYNGRMWYQNGLFIIMGERVLTGTSKNLAYSTDGVNWSSVKFTHSDSGSFSSSPMDVRYGTVGGVTGWYVVGSSSYNSSNVVKLCVFKTLNDLKSGTLTYVNRYTTTASNNVAKIFIRNNKLYVLTQYYAGNVTSTANYVLLMSFNGSSCTQIVRETGIALGTVWSTDRYLIFRGLFQTSNSTTHLVPRYDFTTETYSKPATGGFHQHPYANAPNSGVFVGGRMYQLVATTGGALKGAYSDNYGSSVTQFDTGYTVGYNDNILVFGDEGGGWYQ